MGARRTDMSHSIKRRVFDYDDDDRDDEFGTRDTDVPVDALYGSVGKVRVDECGTDFSPFLFWVCVCVCVCGGGGGGGGGGDI